VVTSVSTTARMGFAGVRSEAFTMSDNAKVGGRFAKVHGDAVTVRGKPSAKAIAAAKPDASEKSTAVATPKVAEAKPAKAAPKPAAEKSSASRTYKVAAGDTLYSIAKKNAIDVNKLRAMNGLKDNNVRLGQVLKVGAR